MCFAIDLAQALALHSGGGKSAGGASRLVAGDWMKAPLVPTPVHFGRIDMSAMINWPEVLVILVILAVLVGGAALVFFLVLRAATTSSRLQTRVENLEREVAELRRTPPPNH